MTEDQRSSMIEWLLMWTMWNREALEKMDDDKLEKEYERNWGKR
ncbi:BH0509 family protein [Sporosarcina sp. E16_8]|nr:BH0509 family protein [Sporosarcina sp. E16_8]MBO0586477.1 BH0509 family protein [Sporosarcina sp. E16_8]